MNTLLRLCSVVVLMSLGLVNCFAGTEGQSTAITGDQEDLDLYRMAIPELRARIEKLERERGGGDASENIEYGRAVAQQRIQIGESAVRALKWQLFASNVLLWVAVFLVVSGTFLAGFQLVIGGGNLRWGERTGPRSASKSERERDELGKGLPETRIEISADNISIQTSIVGVVILALAGVFLVFFLREVYHIEYISSPNFADKARAVQQ
jgi:hypothetical protein